MFSPYFAFTTEKKMVCNLKLLHPGSLLKSLHCSKEPPLYLSVCFLPQKKGPILPLKSSGKTERKGTSSFSE